MPRGDASPIILITREQQGGQNLADLLTLDAAYIHSIPLFNVVYSEHTAPASALTCIITSRHSAQWVLRQNWPLTGAYVVGEETAALLQQAGVHVALWQADAQALLAALKALPEAIPLTYLRGAHVQLDMAKALQAYHPVENMVVYDVVMDEAMNIQLQEFISQLQQPLIVPLLSRRTARQVAGALWAENPRRRHAFHLVALSEAVLMSVAEFPWASAHVAFEPNLAALAKACTNVWDSITHTHEP